MPVLESTPGATGDAGQQRAIVRGVFTRPERRRTQEVGQHVAPIRSTPTEGVVGDAVGLTPAQLVGDEIRQAGSRHQRRQCPREAETVRQPHNFGVHAKLAFEIAGPDQHLACERLTVRQVAVWFDPHATDGLPSTLTHSLADALEGFGRFRL